MAIEITAKAAEHIKASLAKRGSGIGLRIKIKLSGCSGYAYVTDYADKIEADDQVFEAHDARVIIDAKSLKLIDGTEVDYVTKGINQILVFNNPKAESLCGCGESFTIAADEDQSLVS